MEADMIRRFAFACAIAALSTSPTWAQTSTAPATQPGPSASPSAEKFVQSQSINEWRAAKLVGVSVVGSDNKKIGQIKDVLIDHDGAAQVVVISAGGFLGVGGKLVGVPFKEMKWHTEGRTVEISTAPPPNGGAGAGGSGGTGVATTKTDPAATEANQGYPDVAQLDMTDAQLKQAPEFKYAPEPVTPGESGSSASTTTGQSGTTRTP
jgi:sporulation protein YlmC with PRC-barrel domain